MPLTLNILAWSTSGASLPSEPLHLVLTNATENPGRFPLSPKFRTFRLEIKWNGTISAQPNRNIWAHLGRWSTLTSLIISVNQTEMPLLQNCCSQYRSFVTCLQEQWPNVRCLGSNWCNRNVPFHWARGMSEILNPNSLLNGKCPLLTKPWIELGWIQVPVTLSLSFWVAGKVPVQFNPGFANASVFLHSLWNTKGFKQCCH